MATKSLIESIKVLRERTGAGMMDCKKALLENNEDIDLAADWLREKGIAKAAKKASRIAAEGKTLVKTCAKCGTTIVLEINCETDFVSKGDAFEELMQTVADLLLKEQPATLEEAKELTKQIFIDATVKIGEKLDLRRFAFVKAAEGKSIGCYTHMGGKISTAVLLDVDNVELAENLAMHIAANNPTYLTPDDIPADVKEKELAIQIETAKNDPKLSGKPEEMLKKILTGKVNKTLYESVLSEQVYLLDDSKKVSQVLLENKAHIVQFVRFGVGEGIEKRHDDFAEEVMSQIK